MPNPTDAAAAPAASSSKPITDGQEKALQLAVIAQQINLAMSLIDNEEPATLVKGLLEDAKKRLVDVLSAIGGGQSSGLDDNPSGNVVTA